MKKIVQSSQPVSSSFSRQTSQSPRYRRWLFRFFVVGVLIIIIVIAAYATYRDRTRLVAEQQSTTDAKNILAAQLDRTFQDLATTSAQLQAYAAENAQLKAEDQRIRNDALQAEIKNIQSTFNNAVKTYEDVIDLRGQGAKTQALESSFSLTLTQLSKRNYASASSTLAKMTKDIQTLKAQLAATSATAGFNVEALKASNTAPGSGYSRQVVENDIGKFVVDILAADLNSTRVQVETASAGDCPDNCPVASLSDYVSRSGGFAGINGPYFCPAEYPSCAGKTNSYDTLIMNKSKTFFNSDNNVYSVVPAYIFSGNSGRVENSSGVGRDGGYDAVIAAQPALIRGGEVAFGGDGDPKKGSRGSRSFIAVKGNTVFIGIVRNATVAEVARVMKTLGMDSALNLDSGGSTAFMANGRYIAGPGRSTPFGIVLVRK